MELADEHAAVTPIELFFDLVFVFALTQVTDFLFNGGMADFTKLAYVS